MSTRSVPAPIWCFPACVGMDAGLLEQSKADGNAVDMDERGLRLGLGRGGETQ